MDKSFLNRAIELAQESVEAGGFPAGAVVVRDGTIIGEGVSIGSIIHDPTAHGETVAIRNACNKLETSELTDATLYASMEPCVMCLSAAMWSSISRIVFACPSNKVSNQYYGGTYDEFEINEKFNKPIEIVHVPECESASLDVVTAWEKTLG